MMIRTGTASIALAAFTALAFADVTPADAQSHVRYDLPAQDLGTSLRSVGKISGREIIIATGAIEGKMARPLHGSFGADEAIRSLLAGSGVTVQFSRDAVLVGGQANLPTSSTTIPSSEGPIVVTGSRIRGYRTPSPITVIDRAQIVDSGQTDLGSMARSLPQSFAGGQNPEIAAGTSGFQNQNLNSSSSLNLRGLGPDATLTLLNGHRLAYDGALQAIDLSAIPLAAVDRVEVLTDGASAIYGSDAVGGVANVILRKDYDGIETTARMGAATDGGDFEQQYDIVAGHKWSGGGLIATYDFRRTTAVTAGDRSYTSSLDPSTTLIPFIKQHAAVLSGHQNIGSSITVSVDGTFEHRVSSSAFARTTTSDYREAGQFKSPSVTSFSVAPRVDWHGPSDWLISLAGVYGRDKTQFNTDIYSSGNLLESIPGYYTNVTKTAEASAEGKIVTLPGGDVRVALGAGYRNVGLRNATNIIVGGNTYPAAQFNGQRTSYYGYGEVLIPLVNSDMNLTAIRRAEFSAAVRYESYRDIGHVATPKLGVRYEPFDGLQLRGTWGRSFKTPELYQQYTGYEATLYDASDVGAVNPGPDKTVLYLDGGNPNLKPERANSWSVGVQVEPSKTRLKLEANYFHIRYKDRIVSVDAPLSGLLENPLYAQLITRNPDTNVVSSIADGSAGGIYNQSSTSYDPLNVIDIIDGRFINVASQVISGVDFSGDYRLPIGRSQLHLLGSASYLKSSQRLLAQSPRIAMAGTIYNPAHWRARGGAIFEGKTATAAAYLTYVGPVEDNEVDPTTTIGSLTTVDLSGTYRVPSRNAFANGITLQLTILNVLNAKPSHVPVTTTTDPAYDSTNYSALGRTVSVSICKKW